MAVLLRTRTDLPADGFEAWASLDALDTALPPACREETALVLEAEFPSAARRWWELARGLAAGPGSDLSHAVVCSPNASDLGLMLAWTALVDNWAAREQRMLVVCDDPWLFRHLATRTGVSAGKPPPLAEIRPALRGLASRCRYALRAALAALKGRGARKAAPPGASWLLVYGHPRSAADGTDAYFGPLMQKVPALRRALHVDSAPPLIAGLAGDDRSAPLVAWGSPLAALLKLPFARWRPVVEGEFAWLIRRAATLEGGTGTAAAIRWQQLCQRAWIGATRPAAISWPWENHAWERDLVRAARAAGSRTIGYQHSVVGTQVNVSPRSFPDGLAAFPDLVLCTGSAPRDQLIALGAPPERLDVAGALRYPPVAPLTRDPDGPVFLALPFEPRIAAQMLEAARDAAARHGFTVLAKDHPLFPIAFDDGGGVTRTKVPLSEHRGLAGVVFCATTVGLEGLAAGLPVLRFLPRGIHAVDILPPDIQVPAVDAAGLGAALLGLKNMPSPPGQAVQNANFAPADLALWRRCLEGNPP